MRVLVTGAAGQLGRAIVEEFRGRHEVIGFTIDELDICDQQAVLNNLEAVRPGAVVNCAAYTDVDGAEEHPVEALEVNASAVRGLALAAEKVGACLVHYSTDFVFDGHADRPYTEDDPPNPRSTYACSKLLGEWFAAEASRHYVLRVESLFGALPGAGETRRTSVDRIVDGIVAGNTVRVFSDRTVSPSYTRDVSAATRELLDRGAPPGLYHCVNSGACTWMELAQEIGRILRVDPELLAVSMGEAKLLAERPVYCALSNTKLGSTGISMPSWQDAVADYLRVSGVARP